MDGSPLLTVLLKLAVVFLLVLANAFFVGAEFALVSVRRSRIAGLIAAGHKRARLLLDITQDLTGYISACQVGVTLASLALGYIGENTVAHLLNPLTDMILSGFASAVAAHSTAVAIAFVVITYLHLVLGEFVPKALALERTEKIALAVARPMEIFYRVFKFPIWTINRSGVLLLQWLGSKSTVEHEAA
jgi:CBS domain containing-hemolysin-like protein